MNTVSWLEWALAAASFAAWMLMSRYLFRRWVRNDALSKKNPACSHGYGLLHKNQSCHGRSPLPHAEVALCAILASLIFPVTLFVLFVMRNPPLSNRELAEKTRALEEENTRLRRLQGEA